MLRSITLENFRGFEHTEVSGFRRVNLITGKNNVGKTALQENKSRAQAFLAMEDKPEKRVGLAAMQGVWDFDHSAFKELRDFLRKF